MDARGLLRRYLEQRREMGERELVLDGMSVEEVLKILGAAGPSTDWRAALREAGAAPAAKPRATPDGGRPHRYALSHPESGERSALPPPAPAKTRGHRFDTPTDAKPLPEPPAGISVGGEEAAGDAAPAFATLEEIANSVAGCRRCPLYATATKPVPGEGNPGAELVCVGEAPGENEDLEGRPFVGTSGQLLTRILAAIDLKRDEVFICNVLKHRPPGNRNPAPDEIAACSPYLVRQIELIRPKVILAFGKFAAQTLLECEETLGKLRQKVHRYHGVPLIATYHPAALLRNPSWKRAAWEDVQLARRILDRTPPLGPRA